MPKVTVFFCVLVSSRDIKMIFLGGKRLLLGFKVTESLILGYKCNYISILPDDFLRNLGHVISRSTARTLYYGTHYSDDSCKHLMPTNKSICDVSIPTR